MPSVPPPSQFTRLEANTLRQRLERKHVVAKDQAVAEQVGLAHTLGTVVALAGVFQQNARLQAWALDFANPGQFEFLEVVRHKVHDPIKSLIAKSHSLATINLNPLSGVGSPVGASVERPLRRSFLFFRIDDIAVSFGVSF